MGEIAYIDEWRRVWQPAILRCVICTSTEARVIRETVEDTGTGLDCAVCDEGHMVVKKRYPRMRCHEAEAWWRKRGSG